MSAKKPATPTRDLPKRAQTLLTPPRFPATHGDNTAATQATAPRVRVSPLTQWTLAFSDGQRILITGTGVVGRDPRTDEGYQHTVTITDPARLLSRNHFAFGLTPENTPWISDLESANGTYLDNTPLPPSIRTAIAPGNLIRFGDHTARILIG